MDQIKLRLLKEKYDDFLRLYSQKNKANKKDGKILEKDIDRLKVNMINYFQLMNYDQYINHYKNNNEYFENDVEEIISRLESITS